MDFTPLKGNVYTYRTRGIGDFVLNKKHLINLTLLCVVCGALVVYVLRGEELKVLLSTLFASLVLVVFLYSFLDSRIRKLSRERWSKFIAVNNLSSTNTPTVPPVFDLGLHVFFGYAPAVIVNNYELAFHSVLYRSLFGSAYYYKAKRKIYTTVCFTLRKNLPHIFINVKSNDPMLSVLDATNIENIYGISSFSKQKIAHPQLSSIADIYCNKHDTDRSNAILHKLSAINDLLRSKPAFDIEIFNNHVWLIFNGDNRTPDKLPEILEIADKLKDSLVNLEALGHDTEYTYMKTQKTISK